MFTILFEYFSNRTNRNNTDYVLCKIKNLTEYIDTNKFINKIVTRDDIVKAIKYHEKILITSEKTKNTSG